MSIVLSHKKMGELNVKFPIIMIFPGAYHLQKHPKLVNLNHNISRFLTIHSES